jgi:acetolactate decarboxylase
VAPREVLTQVSTINAIMSGVYDGVTSIGTLKQTGDFGIGTLEGLDGEMIILDGSVYQVRADGKTYGVSDGQKTPFASVTYFDEDRTTALPEGMDFAVMQKFLDGSLPSENLFYALKIEGTFSYMKTRSVPGQSKPYPPLVEVTKDQPGFEFQNVKGTVVGFRCPPYVAGVNVAGYHLHFLTEDKTSGGHLLDLKVKEATVSVDDTAGFLMVLPGEGSDFYKIDLSQDRQQEVAEAEK